VAPLEVACWYGNSVPCSISALVLSAVTMRGLGHQLALAVRFQRGQLEVQEAVGRRS
jgi:hypothetical protein